MDASPDDIAWDAARRFRPSSICKYPIQEPPIARGILNKAPLRSTDQLIFSKKKMFKAWRDRT